MIRKKILIHKLQFSRNNTKPQFINYKIIVSIIFGVYFQIQRYDCKDSFIQKTYKCNSYTLLSWLLNLNTKILTCQTKQSGTEDPKLQIFTINILPRAKFPSWDAWLPNTQTQIYPLKLKSSKPRRLQLLKINQPTQQHATPRSILSSSLRQSLPHLSLKMTFRTLKLLMHQRSTIN